MIKNFPGIFNEVIGPVMRGPSSSHTAGSYRIGQLIRQLAGGHVKAVTFLFHPGGSLASTYHTQGSDIGLAAGILGMDMTDPDVPVALDMARSQQISLEFIIQDYPAEHPNTYRCNILDQDGNHYTMTALSTGGGMIEIIEYQGYELLRRMDFPLLLIEGNQPDLSLIQSRLSEDPVLAPQILKSEMMTGSDQSLLLVDFRTQVSDLPADWLAGQVLSQRILDPVYPSLGYAGTTLPFRSAADIEGDPGLSRQSCSELAIAYESARSGTSREDIIHQMSELVHVFREAIETGLNGTVFHDRILGSQSPGFMQAERKGRLLPAGPLSRMTAYIMAIMESKSAYQVIIAAPTAGAAGGLPGALIGMAEELDSHHEDLVHAFLAAGLIGVFVSQEATFAAEVAGCQAETGAGAAMAAAGLVQLMNGTAAQAMGAASIALQNIMGLVCDPVGNRVEVPCLSRNVQAASNALISANMILGGVDPVIPLSESIQTMLKVGQSMPSSLRCTAMGGLADTPTARRIEQQLKRNLHADH